LGADALQVGIVNAAQFAPYAVLGLLAGVWVDRWRRRPTLVIASLGRAAALAAIPVLWVLGLLDVWVVAALMLVFGGFSVFGFAASQSLLPRIVPRQRLLGANARLDQGEAAAQTAGPTLGGALVSWLGAPLTIALDALTYLVEAVLTATIRMEEKRMPRRRRRLAAEAIDGLRATYRHPSLGRWPSRPTSGSSPTRPVSRSSRCSRCARWRSGRSSTGCCSPPSAPPL
jgi:MFS family permease